jgi:hypothetical protein
MIKANWFKILMFALAVALDALMDHFNFHVAHDSGWFSLHTEGYRGFGGDVWHTLKILKWTAIVFGMAGKISVKYSYLYFYGLCAALNYFIHESILHGRKKK